MNAVTKRFFETIEILGLSNYKIAQSVPVASNAKLSNAKNGANEISMDVVSAVCEHYKNINGNYILTGRGEPIITESDIFNQSKEVRVMEERFNKILEDKPNIDRVEAANVLMGFFEATMKLAETFGSKK